MGNAKSRVRSRFIRRSTKEQQEDIFSLLRNNDREYLPSEARSCSENDILTLHYERTNQAAKKSWKSHYLTIDYNAPNKKTSSGSGLKMKYFRLKRQKRRAPHQPSPGQYCSSPNLHAAGKPQQHKSSNMPEICILEQQDDNFLSSNNDETEHLPSEATSYSVDDILTLPYEMPNQFSQKSWKSQDIDNVPNEMTASASGLKIMFLKLRRQKRRAPQQPASVQNATDKIQQRASSGLKDSREFITAVEPDGYNSSSHTDKTKYAYFKQWKSNQSLLVQDRKKSKSISTTQIPQNYHGQSQAEFIDTSWKWMSHQDLNSQDQKHYDDTSEKRKSPQNLFNVGQKKLKDTSQKIYVRLKRPKRQAPATPFSPQSASSSQYQTLNDATTAENKNKSKLPILSKLKKSFPVKQIVRLMKRKTQSSATPPSSTITLQETTPRTAPEEPFEKGSESCGSDSLSEIVTDFKQTAQASSLNEKIVNKTTKSNSGGIRHVNAENYDREHNYDYFALPTRKVSFHETENAMVLSKNKFDTTHDSHNSFITEPRETFPSLQDIYICSDDGNTGIKAKMRFIPPDTSETEESMCKSATYNDRHIQLYASETRESNEKSVIYNDIRIQPNAYTYETEDSKKKQVTNKIRYSEPDMSETEGSERKVGANTDGCIRPNTSETEESKSRPVSMKTSSSTYERHLSYKNQIKISDIVSDERNDLSGASEIWMRNEFSETLTQPDKTAVSTKAKEILKKDFSISLPFEDQTSTTTFVLDEENQFSDRKRQHYIADMCETDYSTSLEGKDIPKLEQAEMLTKKYDLSLTNQNVTPREKIQVPSLASYEKHLDTTTIVETQKQDMSTDVRATAMLSEKTNKQAAITDTVQKSAASTNEEDWRPKFSNSHKAPYISDSLGATENTVMSARLDIASEISTKPYVSCEMTSEIEYPHHVTLFQKALFDMTSVPKKFQNVFEPKTGDNWFPKNQPQIHTPDKKQDETESQLVNVTKQDNNVINKTYAQALKFEPGIKKSFGITPVSNQYQNVFESKTGDELFSRIQPEARTSANNKKNQEEAPNTHVIQQEKHIANKTYAQALKSRLNLENSPEGTSLPKPTGNSTESTLLQRKYMVEPYSNGNIAVGELVNVTKQDNNVIKKTYAQALKFEPGIKKSFGITPVSNQYQNVFEFKTGDELFSRNQPEAPTSANNKKNQEEAPNTQVIQQEKHIATKTYAQALKSRLNVENLPEGTSLPKPTGNSTESTLLQRKYMVEPYSNGNIAVGELPEVSSVTQILIFPANDYHVLSENILPVPSCYIVPPLIKISSNFIDRYAVKVCPQYNSKAGCHLYCCFRYHVCYRWVRNSCNMKPCHYHHSFHSPHNKELLTPHLNRHLLKSAFQFEEEMKRNLRKSTYDCKRLNIDMSEHICIPALTDNCYIQSCRAYHRKLSYSWEVNLCNRWVKFGININKELEKLYCNPDCTVSLQKSFFSDIVGHLSEQELITNNFQLNFKSMVLQTDDKIHYSIRRLSTASDVAVNHYLATRWLWFHQDENKMWSFCRYGYVNRHFVMSLSDYLEQQFLRGINHIQIAIRDDRYIIDFKSYEQTHIPSGKVYLIQRRPAMMPEKHYGIKVLPFLQLGELNVARNQFCKVLLQYDSWEFSFVKNMMVKTLPLIKEMKIERINNSYLWKAYQLKKQLLLEKYEGNKITMNEQYLFHGTKPEAVNQICADNFDWRLFGSNIGSIYGQGTYFSNSAYFSDRFASTDEEGYDCMFIALVLVGRCTTGSRDMKIPCIDATTNKRFDTTVNTIRNPQVFVKYNTDDYYPAYFVRYR